MFGSCCYKQKNFSCLCIIYGEQSIVVSNILYAQGVPGMLWDTLRKRLRIVRVLHKLVKVYFFSCGYKKIKIISLTQRYLLLLACMCVFSFFWLLNVILFYLSHLMLHVLILLIHRIIIHNILYV